MQVLNMINKKLSVSWNGLALPYLNQLIDALNLYFCKRTAWLSIPMTFKNAKICTSLFLNLIGLKKQYKICISKNMVYK